MLHLDFFIENSAVKFSIIIFAKKEKEKNLIVYDVNKLLIKIIF